MEALVQPVSDRSRRGRMGLDIVIAAGLFVGAKTSLALTTVSLGLGQYGSGSQEKDAFKGSLRIIELGHEDNYIEPGEPGWLSSVRVNHSSTPKSVGNSISLDQGLGQGFALGASGSKTKGIADEEGKNGYDSSSLGGRFSFWLRKNTLRIGLEGSSQKTSKDAIDSQDTDGRRILVASDASGSTGTLRFTHLTTPTLILMGNLSQTRATGRPVALSFGTELRRYIVPVKAAVHVAFDRYTDLADVDTTTLYGRVSADTQTLRYHQRLPADFVMSSVTKWHQETEIPRSVESKISKKRGISEVVSLRWRDVQGSWTEESSEIGVFGGFFTRRETKDTLITADFVRMYGVQLKAAF